MKLIRLKLLKNRDCAFRANNFSFFLVMSVYKLLLRAILSLHSQLTVNVKINWRYELFYKIIRFSSSICNKPKPHGRFLNITLLFYRFSLHKLKPLQKNILIFIFFLPLFLHVLHHQEQILPVQSSHTSSTLISYLNTIIQHFSHREDSKLRNATCCHAARATTLAEQKWFRCNFLLH